MNFESIELKVDNGLARLTLNSPDLGNPLNAALCREMPEAAEALYLDKDVRAVLVSAKGRFFCVGGDINMFAKDRSGLPAGILHWTRQLHAGLARLWQLNAPIVTAVHATAAGGAMGLIAGSDVVYCGKSAKLSAAYAKLGFSCDAGVTHALALRMGIARARRFLLLSEVLSAVEAREAGLVDFVVEDDQVLIEAEKTARRLAEGPTQAFGQIRRLMMTALKESAPSQMELEAQGLAQITATEDAWEGVMSFVERRKPVFRGR